MRTINVISPDGHTLSTASQRAADSRAFHMAKVDAIFWRTYISFYQRQHLGGAGM